MDTERVPPQHVELQIPMIDMERSTPLLTVSRCDEGAELRTRVRAAASEGSSGWESDTRGFKFRSAAVELVVLVEKQRHDNGVPGPSSTYGRLSGVGC